MICPHHGRAVLLTFEDVAIYFLTGGVGLLDEAQRHLYHKVMLENFALTASLGKAPHPSVLICVVLSVPQRQLCSFHSQTMGSACFPTFLAYVVWVPVLG